MIDLKEYQAKFDAWRLHNFGDNGQMHDALRHIAGMAEEVGEVSHLVLKRDQGIREAVSMTEDEFKAELVDGVADTMIFGMNLLSLFGIDLEDGFKAVADKALQRDWKANPKTAVAETTEPLTQTSTFEVKFLGDGDTFPEGL